MIDIAHNAYAAAFTNSHFAPLNPAEDMSFSSEAELIAQLRPNIDGLILNDSAAWGTFLPSVWEQLPEPRDFLTQLKRKAGLPAHYWSDTLKVKRYTTTAFP